MAIYEGRQRPNPGDIRGGNGFAEESLANINRGGDQNRDVNSWLTAENADHVKNIFNTMASLPGEVQNQYRQGKQFAGAEESHAQQMRQGDLTAEGTRYSNDYNKNVAEEATRNNAYLSAVNPATGKSHYEEQKELEAQKGTQGLSNERLSGQLTQAQIAGMGRTAANEQEDRKYQQAVLELKGANMQQNPQAAISQVAQKYGLDGNRLAAANKQASTIDYAQASLNPNFQASQKAIGDARTATGALTDMVSAAANYAKKSNDFKDPAQARDETERFASALEKIGDKSTADLIRQNWARRLTDFDARPREKIMSDALNTNIGKVKDQIANIKATVGTSNELLAAENQLSQLEQAARTLAGSTSKNTHSPTSGSVTAGQNSQPVSPWQNPQQQQMAPQTMPVSNQNQPRSLR